VTFSDLPALNATLNAVSAVFLTAGYRQIRNKNVPAHRACMLAAFGASTLFLISYVIYHAHAGSVRFLRQGWIRPVYFSILITHVMLAAAILPLALVTLTRALRERFDQHRQIARWTLPVWLYVSVTGVIVYLMLYRL
jgi:putative membrane protein